MAIFQPSDPNASIFPTRGGLFGQANQSIVPLFMKALAVQRAHELNQAKLKEEQLRTKTGQAQVREQVRRGDLAEDQFAAEKAANEDAQADRTLAFTMSMHAQNPGVPRSAFEKDGRPFLPETVVQDGLDPSGGPISTEIPFVPNTAMQAKLAELRQSIPDGTFGPDHEMVLHFLATGAGLGAVGNYMQTQAAIKQAALAAGESALPDASLSQLENAFKSFTGAMAARQALATKYRSVSFDPGGFKGFFLDRDLPVGFEVLDAIAQVSDSTNFEQVADEFVEGLTGAFRQAGASEGDITTLTEMLRSSQGGSFEMFAKDADGNSANLSGAEAISDFVETITMMRREGKRASDTLFAIMESVPAGSATWAAAAQSMNDLLDLPGLSRKTRQRIIGASGVQDPGAPGANAGANDPTSFDNFVDATGPSKAVTDAASNPNNSPAVLLNDGDVLSPYEVIVGAVDDFVELTGVKQAVAAGRAGVGRALDNVGAKVIDESNKIIDHVQDPNRPDKRKARGAANRKAVADFGRSLAAPFASGPSEPPPPTGDALAYKPSLEKNAISGDGVTHKSTATKPDPVDATFKEMWLAVLKREGPNMTLIRRRELWLETLVAAGVRDEEGNRLPPPELVRPTFPTQSGRPPAPPALSSERKKRLRQLRNGA